MLKSPKINFLDIKSLPHLIDIQYCLVIHTLNDQAFLYLRRVRVADCAVFGAHRLWQLTPLKSVLKKTETIT